MVVVVMVLVMVIVMVIVTVIIGTYIGPRTNASCSNKRPRKLVLFLASW